MLSVCNAFCGQDYLKRSPPVSLICGVMIGLSKSFTFGGDLVMDMDYGSLFCFSHRCRIG